MLDETGLLPHLNPGVLTRDDLVRCGRVSASMGLMLETTAARLGERGGPTTRLAGQAARARLETLAARGSGAIPFTTGILIGIGETRAERLDALLAIRERRAPRARAGGDRPELPREARHAHGRPPGAVARGAPLDDRGGARPARPEVHVQAPPNLAYDDFPACSTRASTTGAASRR